MRRNDKKTSKRIAFRLVFTFALTFGFSIIAFGQTQEFEETPDIIVPEQAMEQIVRRVLVWSFKPRSKPTIIYADDATIYFPSYSRKKGGSIRGREAIDKYWLDMGKPKAWKLEITEVGGTRDAIWEIGKSTLTAEYDGKDSTYVGDFIVIWKRQKDGSYRIYTDIYN